MRRIARMNEWRKAHRWLTLHGLGDGRLLTATASSVVVAGGAAVWFDAFGVWAVLGLALILFCLSMAGRLMRGRSKRHAKSQD